MYVSPVKHEEEEKVVFRTSRPQPSRLIQKRSNLEIETQPTPLYSNLISRHYPIPQFRLPQLTPTPRRSRNVSEPFRFRSNRDLMSALNKTPNFEQVTTEKNTRKHRSKSRKLYRRIPTSPRVPTVPYQLEADIGVEQINQILLSTESKQIVLRLQRLNSLLRRLSFITVQELILVCRLVRYDKNEYLFHHKKTQSTHGFILITGSVLLKNVRYRSRFVMYENSTLEEQNVIACRYNHHKQRFNVGKSTSDNTVCLRISRSEWEMVRRRLIDQYQLHEDVKLFESVLRKNFCEKMSELNQAIYKVQS